MPKKCYSSNTSNISYLISTLESGGDGTAPPTPKKIATTASTEVNLHGSVNLKVYHTNLDEWVSDIIVMIDNELKSKVLNPQGKEVEDTRMTRQIFTLGELAQICPHKINRRLFLIIQGIVITDDTIKKRRKDIPSTQTQVNIS